MSVPWDGSWGQFGSVLKSDILDPGPASPLAALHARIVDVVCAGCGERLAQINDDAEGPVFTKWTPTTSPATFPGEPRWALIQGSVPTTEEYVMVHCFTHGDLRLEGLGLLDSITKYRSRGRTTRHVLQVK